MRIPKLQLLVCLLLITALWSPPAHASVSSQVEQYYASTEPLSLSTSVAVHPYDVDPVHINADLNDSQLIRSSTLRQNAWLGALPLDRGYAVSSFADVASTINATVSFSVDHLDLPQANLTIGFFIYINRPHSRSAVHIPIFDGTVQQGNHSTIQISERAVASAAVLTNGSILPFEGYYYLLNTTDSAYYSTLSVQFQTTGQYSWNGTASVSLQVDGMQNPSFFALMQSRLQTQQDSTPSPASHSYLPYYLFAVVVLVIVVGWWYWRMKKLGRENSQS